MKLQKVDYRSERQILIGMIIDKDFLREIENEFDLNYFKNKASRELVKWCLDYWNKYHDVPKKEIESIYYDKKNKLDEDVREYIEELLMSISNEYDYKAKNFNTHYFVDKALEYFNKCILEDIQTKIGLALENGKLDEAESLLQSYKPIQLIEKSQLNPFESELYVEEVFKSVGEQVFKLPGAIGSMLNNQLYRASLIAFQGAEKVGKSWFLQEIAIRALKQRRKVAIFEAGDMTKSQRLARIYARLAKRPWIPGKSNGSDKFIVPFMSDDILSMYKSKDFKERQKIRPEDVEFIVTNRRLLTPTLVRNRLEKWKSKYGNYLRISVHQNNSLTPKMMDKIIEDWVVKEDFLPDVIIVDYADILACQKRIVGNDQRHYINEIWKELRAISQKWQVILITATQADSKSYKKPSQDLTNFSEDKRKYSHVTAMFALNRTQIERSLGILRVQQLLIREAPPNLGGKQVLIMSDHSTAEPWKYSFLVDPGYSFVADVPVIETNNTYFDENDDFETKISNE